MNERKIIMGYSVVDTFSDEVFKGNPAEICIHLGGETWI